MKDSLDPNNSSADIKDLGTGKPALYQARLQRVRNIMRRHQVPVLLVLDPLNIHYATGASNMELFSLRTPARYYLLFAEGPSILFEYFGCEHLAADLDTIDDIRPAMGLCRISSGDKVEENAGMLATEIHSLVNEFAHGTDTLAIDRFPYAVTDALRAVGFRLSDSDQIFSTARAIKLECELPYLREAMRRVDNATTELAAAIRPGASENAVWAQFHQPFMATEGRYIATRLFQSGPNTFPYFQESSSRIMKAGDLICFDTDATGYERYGVDYSRTFLCGDIKATEEQRKLYALAKEQLDWNAALIRPGVEYREIAERAWPVPEAHQQSRYYCIGHGLGMSGEFPNIPHAVPNKPYPLTGTVEPGMILCVESYIGSEQSGQGVKLEDQFLITETGIECMSQFPFEDSLLASLS